jgi:hypothetical protein
VEGFRPGTDTLTLTSETWDFDLYDLGNDGTGVASKSCWERSGRSSASRARALPVDDVHLHVSEPGEEPQRVALRDALSPEGDVLAPADPDAPDEMPEDDADRGRDRAGRPGRPDVPPDAPDPERCLRRPIPDAPEERPDR